MNADPTERAPFLPPLPTARRLTRDEKRDAAYREGAAYLRTLGIDTQTEITRVLDIAMNPNSLFADRQTNKMRSGNASVSCRSQTNTRCLLPALLTTNIRDC